MTALLVFAQLMMGHRKGQRTMATRPSRKTGLLCSLRVSSLLHSQQWEAGPGYRVGRQWSNWPGAAERGHERTKDVAHWGSGRRAIWITLSESGTPWDASDSTSTV
ncbi:hypothetical protein HD554DRAFT_2037162 [Boletus coccyginus]|nr:hypothetical protein HD554DRAFT_2037162 [Boletus coccyginus]